MATICEHLRLPAYPALHTFRRISALLPSLARLGLDGSFAPIVPLAGWLPRQDRLARLSTNSSLRLVS